MGIKLCGLALAIIHALFIRPIGMTALGDDNPMFKLYSADCDFLNEANECVNCHLFQRDLSPLGLQMRANELEHGPRTPPGKPSWMRAVSYRTNSQVGRTNLGLRVLIQHPTDADHVSGYFIMCAFELDLHSEQKFGRTIANSFVIDLRIPPGSLAYDDFKDSLLPVDIPLNEILTDDILLKRRFRLWVCSEPGIKSYEWGNCYPDVSLFLPNLTDASTVVRKTAKTCEIGDVVESPPFDDIPGFFKDYRDLSFSEKVSSILFLVISVLIAVITLIICIKIYQVFCTKKIADERRCATIEVRSPELRQSECNKARKFQVSGMLEERCSVLDKLTDFDEQSTKSAMSYYFHQFYQPPPQSSSEQSSSTCDDSGSSTCSTSRG